MRKVDIIVVGGGVMGSSIAYNLLNDGFDGDLLVIEKDSTYEYSATTRSEGGVRHLFATDANIQISKFNLQMYKEFPETMAIDGEKAEVDFKQSGYLVLGTEQTLPQLEKQLYTQRRYGIPTQLLQKHELLNIIPELNISDLEGGIYDPDAGYYNPQSVLQGYVRKSKQLGAEFINGEVEMLLTEGNQMKGVRLTDGREFFSTIVINSSGPWASSLSERIGLPLPIVPLKVQVFQFDTSTPLENFLPLTIDPTGIYFRHEGKSIIAGSFIDVDQPGIDFRNKMSYFTEKYWPILANRIQNFETVKLRRGYVGMIGWNTIDHNAIIGLHPKMKGYYLAAGFSGHGFQQAPAVGKGLSELIRKGKYETIDLSPFKLERFEENNQVRIENLILPLEN